MSNNEQDTVMNRIRELLGIIDNLRPSLKCIEDADKKRGNNAWGILFQAYVYALIAHTIASYGQRARHRSRDACSIVLTHVPRRDKFVFKGSVNAKYRDNPWKYSYLAITMHYRNHPLPHPRYLLLFNVDSKVLANDCDAPIMNLDIALVKDNQYGMGPCVRDPVSYDDVRLFVECKGGNPAKLGRRTISTEDIAAFIGQVHLLSYSIERDYLCLSYECRDVFCAFLKNHPPFVCTHA